MSKDQEIAESEVKRSGAGRLAGGASHRQQGMPVTMPARAARHSTEVTT